MKASDCIKRIIDAVYPKDIKCINCGREIFKPMPYSLCTECFSKLEFIEKCCQRCGAKNISDTEDCKECHDKKFQYMTARAPVIYNSVARNLILRLKAGGEKYLAEYLSDIMLISFKKLNMDFDFIVCVPLSGKTLKKRGFNQADLLAKSLSEKTGIKYLPSIVEKIKETSLQVDNKRDERLKNLKGAFSVNNPSIIEKKRILLVDDVITTTATVSEIAEGLKKAGAKSVSAIAFARACLQ